MTYLICNQCKKIIKNEDTIHCFNCKLNYHLTCLNFLKRKKIIYDNNTRDFTICHICNKIGQLYKMKIDQITNKN